MSEPTPHTSPLALWRAIQRLKAQAAQLESIVSVINGDGGGGGGDAFDDTTGVATLTGNRGWDGAATHNVSISGAEAAIRGDTNIKLVTPGIIATAVSTGWVLTVTDAATGAVEFQEAAGGSFLPLAGGTMSGQINMGSQKITSLGTPTANADGVTKLYVDQRDDTWETVTYAAGATTSVNNMNIGSSTANRVIVTASVAVGGVFTITGIVASTLTNKLLVVYNGISVPIQLSSLDASSSSANQISCPTDANSTAVTGRSLAPGDSAVLYYTGTKWYVVDVIRPGNHDFVQMTSGGISVDATFCLRPGGPFEFVTAAANNFYALPAISTDTATRVVELFNKTGGSVTIYYDSAPGGATPTAWGIYTPTGANVTWPNLTSARFAYDRAVTRWRLLNTPA